MHTLEELENAQSALDAWEERFDRYSGNNPNKYQADIKLARRRVRNIEDALKNAGEIPLSEKEQLERELNGNYPAWVSA